MYADTLTINKPQKESKSAEEVLNKKELRDNLKSQIKLYSLDKCGVAFLREPCRITPDLLEEVLGEGTFILTRDKYPLLIGFRLGVQYSNPIGIGSNYQLYQTNPTLPMPVISYYKIRKFTDRAILSYQNTQQQLTVTLMPSIDETVIYTNQFMNYKGTLDSSELFGIKINSLRIPIVCGTMMEYIIIGRDLLDLFSHKIGQTLDDYTISFNQSTLLYSYLLSSIPKCLTDLKALPDYFIDTNTYNHLNRLNNFSGSVEEVAQECFKLFRMKYPKWREQDLCSTGICLHCINKK